MTQLSVNVNKIALLRNSRDIGIPSVIQAARICVDAGAGGITVHPRPDQRHIRPGDVYELAEMLSVEFNIEGNPFAEARGDYPGFMEIVRRVRPTQCTLVPDDPGQFTSDHGWDLTANAERLAGYVEDIDATIKEQLGERMLPEAGLFVLMKALEERGRDDLAQFYMGQLMEVTIQKQAHGL